MQKMLTNKMPVDAWPQLSAKAVSNPAFAQKAEREWFWSASAWIEKTALQAGEVSADIVHFALLEKFPVDGEWAQWIKDNRTLHERLSFILLSSLPPPVLPVPPKMRPLLSAAAGFLLLALLNTPLVFIDPEFAAIWFSVAMIPAFVLFMRLYRRRAPAPVVATPLPWLAAAATGLSFDDSALPEDFRAALLSVKTLIMRAYSYPASWWDVKGKYDVESVLNTHIPQLIKEYESLPSTQRASHHRAFLSQLRSLCIIVQKQVALLAWLQDIEIAARTRYLNSRVART